MAMPPTLALPPTRQHHVGLEQGALQQRVVVVQGLHCRKEGKEIVCGRGGRSGQCAQLARIQNAPPRCSTQEAENTIPAPGTITPLTL